MDQKISKQQIQWRKKTPKTNKQKTKKWHFRLFR